MNKQTESNLFIFSSSLKRAGEFYQHLLSGITTYKELATRILAQIEIAHAFRQVERVRELARVLLNVPIEEYQLTAQYYLVWCKCRELEYHDEVLERIVEQSRTCKTRALFSRGASEWYRGNNEAALYFYLEALKTSPNVSEYVELSRSIAVLKGTEGFHRSAIRDLENVLPLIKYAEPRLYYDFLNSYAVELAADHRLSEAHDTALVAVSSSFGPFYPEWQDTFSEIRSKRKQRSIPGISAREFEEVTTPEPAINPTPLAAEPANPEPRIQIAINFMKVNLHRRVSFTELAESVNLSPTHFSHLFKSETGLSPGKYLTRLKMEKAAQLLATTLLRVKEVMGAVGYNSKGTFSRHFKRYFDVTPSAYRKRAFAKHLPLEF